MIRIELICDHCGTAFRPDFDDPRHVRDVARMLGWTSRHERGRPRDACASCDLAAATAARTATGAT